MSIESLPRRVRPYYPPLLAVFPVLGTYFVNMSLFPLQDLFRPLGIALVLGVALWLLTSAIFRSFERGALVTVPFLVFFWTYGFIENAIPEGNKDKTLYVVLVLTAIALVGAIRIKPPTQTLNRFAAILVFLALFQIGFQLFRAINRPTQTSGLNVAGKTTPGAPDVYYIILDGYGRQDELKRNLDYDNGPFIRQLEGLGFYVAPNAHSNYCQTQISLASSLNYEMVPKLLPDASPAETDREPLNHLVNQSSLVQDFRREGYSTAAILTGFPSFSLSNTDLQLVGPQPTTLFESTLMGMTPLSLSAGETESQFDARRKLLLAAFKDLQDFATPTTTPRFVFAHILAPHPPFVFDKDGNPKRKSPFGYWDGSDFNQYIGSDREYRDGYVGQVQYLNKLVLQTVTKLIKESKRPPIIILQGDHGSKLHLDQNEIEKTDLRECFSNLEAFYVPEAIRKEIDPDITPVNIFRIVLSKLFDADLPKLPNRSYYAPFAFPYRFTDVTDKLKPQPEPADNPEGGPEAFEGVDSRRSQSSP